MNELNKDEKQVVINLLLHKVQGLTVAESATVLGIIQKIQDTVTPSSESDQDLVEGEIQPTVAEEPKE